MKRTALSLLFLGCSIATVSAADITYSQQIGPLVADRCGACHGQDAPEHKAFKQDKEAWVAKGIGPRMDSYAHLVYFTGWPDTGALMRRLDEGGGKDDKVPGNMYRYLGDNDAERQQNLSKFKEWVGVWTLKRFNSLTMDELAGIKVPF